MRALTIPNDDLIRDISRARIAFRHPVVFVPTRQSYCYANTDDEKAVFDADLVGVLPNAADDDALKHTMCLNKTETHLPDRTTVVAFQRPGEALPSELMCWMVPGSRPSFLPTDQKVTDAEIAAELGRHDLSVDGSPDERVARASNYGLTIRKRACFLTLDEARSILYTREARITDNHAEPLRLADSKSTRPISAFVSRQAYTVVSTGGCEAQDTNRRMGSGK